MFTNDDRRAIGEAARAYGLPEAHVLAVTEVESAGVSFATINGRAEPLIRFEGHIFDRKLEGEAREKARNLGLSNPSAGKVKNPTSQSGRWDLLRRAMAIDAAAALEATSWGVGQVMAMHWKRLGFADVAGFVDMVRSGLKGQVDVMLRFVRDAGLSDELAKGQWAPFARGYNGPNYRTNRYDEKLAAAAAKFGGADEPPEGLLRMGSKGRRVRELQELLVRSGAAVKVDGDFGPTTKKALQAFQGLHGLEADGIYGPATESALGELRQSGDDKPGKLKLLDVGAVKRGLGTAVAAGVSASQIQDAKTALESAAGQIAGAGIRSVVLDYLSSGLTTAAALLGAAGVAYAVVGWLRSKQTVEA